MQRRVRAGFFIAVPGVVAVVLAAGRSSRTGDRHKLLATDASGQTMIARTLTQITASKVSGICVVVPDIAGLVAQASERVPEPMVGVRFAIRQSADVSQGLSMSLRAGIACARDWQADGAVICPGDMPLIRSAMIDALVDCHAATGADVVVPECDGRIGNPVLWDARRFGVLMALRGDEGARKLLRLPDIRRASVAADASIFVDFDTPEALDRFSGL
ncbi:nucleotidyltransferase family protein [Acetobacter fallax]|uniref:nucleotidyltransferase family protein n=1 Tax=Acetobacter fallax TaxID=1737473 RepID=UPI0030CD763B